MYVILIVFQSVLSLAHSFIVLTSGIDIVIFYLRLSRLIFIVPFLSLQGILYSLESSRPCQVCV